MINVEGNFLPNVDYAAARSAASTCCARARRSPCRSPRRRSGWRSTSRAGSAPPTARCARAASGGGSSPTRARSCSRAARSGSSASATSAGRCAACSRRSAARVRVHDPWLPARRSAARTPSRAGLDELLAGRASCSSSRPRRATTQGFLGERELRLLPTGAVLLLMSRAGVVDFDALVRVVGEGRLRAAVDVFPEEPLAAGSPARGARRPAALPAPHGRDAGGVPGDRPARGGRPRAGAPRPAARAVQARGGGDGRPHALAGPVAAAPRLTIARGRARCTRMRLYDYAASGNCYKVRLLLALLGRDYERVQVDIFAGDTLTDAYAALNPRPRDAGAGARRRTRSSPSPTRSCGYLARRARRTCRPSRLAQAHVLQWLAFEQERVMGGIGGPRFRRLTGRPERPGRLAIGAEALARARRRTWRERDWLVGDGADDRRRGRVRLRARRADAGLELGRRTCARGWSGCARCRASSPTSRRTGRTPGRARAGRSTADVGSPAWPPGEDGRRGAPRAARAGLRDGAERAGARSHFRSMGIDPDRLDGPIVGIASTWTGTMPCNLDAARALRRRRRGGRRGRRRRARRSTRSRSPTTSRRARPACARRSISREVIADSIELMCIAHDFDALVCIVGCDKTTPAALMALARVDKPAVLLYSGPQRAGPARERELTILDVWEAVAAHERGMIERAELDAIERAACPGAGHLRRAVHREHDGGGARLPRADRAGRRADPGGRGPRGRRRAAAARAGAARRGAGARRARRARALPRPPRAAQRDGRRRGERRLDERRAAPARRSRARRASSSPRTS